MINDNIFIINFFECNMLAESAIENMLFLELHCVARLKKYTSYYLNISSETMLSSDNIILNPLFKFRKLATDNGKRFPCEKIFLE